MNDIIQSSRVETSHFLRYAGVYIDRIGRTFWARAALLRTTQARLLQANFVIRSWPVLRVAALQVKCIRWEIEYEKHAFREDRRGYYPVKKAP